MTSSCEVAEPPACAWPELDPAAVVRPRPVRRGLPVDDQQARLIREAVARAAAEATKRGWRSGHEAGYEAGHREGVRAARAELTAVVHALSAAALDVEQRAATDLADAAQTIAVAALELAESIVGRHIEAAADPGADALARALAMAPPGRLVARLHPADVELFDATSLPDDGRVTIVADPSIERGGCVIEGGATTVDAQVGPAIARAREALLQPGAAA
jgi:flagellar assembly protein FliH